MVLDENDARAVKQVRMIYGKKRSIMTNPILLNICMTISNGSCGETVIGVCGASSSSRAEANYERRTNLVYPWPKLKTIARCSGVK